MPLASSMHLLKGQPRGLTGDAEPVDLEQSPGDIVILSAADTEIAGLAAARRALGEDFPSRPPRQLDGARASLFGRPLRREGARAREARRGAAARRRVLLALRARRGGAACPRQRARSSSSFPATRPGMRRSRRTGRCRRTSRESSGPISSRAARRISPMRLRYCAHLIGEGDEAPSRAERDATLARVRGRLMGAAARLEHPAPSLAAPLPGRGGRPPPIVFYRALMQAGQTEPVDALCAALRERGLKPLPLYVSSLKAKEDAAFVAALFAEHEPAIVLNATAFALSQPGGEFAGTVLDGDDAAGAAGDVRRNLGRGVGGIDARPLADRPHDECRAAGGGRPHHHARRVLQGGGRTRSAHRMPAGPLPAEGRTASPSSPISRRAGRGSARSRTRRSASRSCCRTIRTRMGASPTASASMRRPRRRMC